MGYNHCYLTILEKAPAVALEELQLKPTGERQEFPDAAFVGATLPSGWYVINAEGAENDLVSERILTMISKGCEAIACSVEEHVMVSSAQGWRDGERIWSVVHDSNKRTEHLETGGELPSAFLSLRDDLVAKQIAAGGRKAGVDYVFDVPVELVRSITGYRYDRDTPGLVGEVFEVLEYCGPLASPVSPLVRKSFFQRLFSR